MSYKDIYYGIKVYGRHIRASFPKPITKNRYQLGTFSDATSAVVKTGGQARWKQSLETADLIGLNSPFISLRFKEALEEYCKPTDIQFIPLTVLHKNTAYEDFYIANPLVRMSLINPLASYWDVGSDRVTIQRYYSEEMMEGFRSQYPDVHLSLDPLCPQLYISNEIRKLINCEKFKIQVQPLENSTIIMPNEVYEVLGEEVNTKIWQERLKTARNYPFLKEIFGWED